MKLNADFVNRTEALFGKELYARFSQALDVEPVVSVRYNTRKLIANDDLRVVPWATEGRYLSSRPVFTADPLFHAGCYYVQEASSMFLEQVIKQYVNEPVRALDLCAAPGGKSTHLHSLLPQGSMLVSNEPMPLRAQILAENITKWGNPSSMVTKNMPADFAGFREFFDLLVVDAPCSGEGMFRKEPKAVEQWSVSNVEMCAKRQKEILSDIWPSLRPGGLLVYSTCTFNSEENEQNVRWIAEELGAEVLELNVSPEWGITGSLVDDKLPVYRFIPGATDGEGFFLAVLRKDGDGALSQPRQPRLQLASSKIKSEVEKYIQNPELFNFVQNDDVVVALPKEHTAAMVALQQKLCVLHCGLPVASVKNNKLLPLHSLSMSTSLRKEAFNVVELGLEQALMYLHRETLSLPSAPMGFLLLTYMGQPIGFAKNVGNRANNLYPAEWRIRKNLLDL
ncbi:MAG: rRNA cytosine-C5-methyltransferase [Bacteroidaceae bacterium]|nr:rRNA cytosine-C5-methyltransferase [Bacteroidaceae bacterium]